MIAKRRRSKRKDTQWFLVSNWLEKEEKKAGDVKIVKLNETGGKMRNRVGVG